jgi:uncharacterized protein (DUF362 family)
MIARRRFLQLIGGGFAYLTAGMRSSTLPTYRVGMGNAADAYTATLRAVEASGEWPGAAMADRKVIIKPNLVVPRTAETGITTDPQVVRALVDLALEAGAAQVFIVESGPNGAHFSACGYDFFDAYDPHRRVALISLNNEPVVLAEVPGGGMAYTGLFMPELLLADDVLFISAAKLKCHLHTHATLTTKNLMGLPPPERYGSTLVRSAMHGRGISQTIVDLNLVRPIDFAVVDGVIGGEGNGPVRVTPVRLDLVVAGQNSVAVDRVCLWATSLPQDGVQHLTYAAQKGLGPADVEEVEMVGDAFTPEPFLWPDNLPPLVGYPRGVPEEFTPYAGQQTEITYGVDTACQTRVEILRTSESSPEEIHIRTMRDWADRPPGEETLIWDGRDDDGQVVPPGPYAARVQARYRAIGTSAYATGWIRVTRHNVYMPAVYRGGD